MESPDVTPPSAPMATGAPPPPPVPAPPIPKFGAVGAPPPAPTLAEAPPAAPPISTPVLSENKPPVTRPVTKPQTSDIPPAPHASLGKMRSGSAGRKNSFNSQKVRTPLPVGTRVGNYTITAKIGIGGFGIVYAANHTQDGTPVAIKEHMPEGLAMREPNSDFVHSAPEMEDRFKATVSEFLEEVTVLMGISHPGIVPILTAFEANGTAYYVMPFQKGTPMAVVDQGSLDVTQQAQEARHNKRLLLSLLSTMDYLRLHQIVHRDIKPENILITEEGNTVLLDFGSARQIQPGKVFTNVFTPDFSAPEQSHAESDEEMSASLGPWTDLYALGVCFYYLITHLFPPRSDLRMVSAVDPYTPLAGRADLEYLYGAAFLRAIDRALELKISDRWQSAAAWRIAIGEGMVPVQQKKERHIRPATAITIGALTLFAGVSIWALRERSLALSAFETSMNLNGHLLLDFSQEISDTPASARLQNILGERLHNYLSQMERPPGIEEEKYLRTLAAAWRHFGAINMQHGRLDEADHAFQQAEGALKQLQKDDPDSILSPYDLSTVLLGRVEVARKRNHLDQARKYLSDAIRILDKLCHDAPHNPDFLCTLGQAMGESALLAQAEGNSDDYRKDLKEMTDLYRDLLSSFPEHIKAREGLGAVLQNDARVAMKQKNFEEASQVLEESCRLFSELCNQHPYNLSFEQGLAQTYFTMGALYNRLSADATDDKLRKQYDEQALDAFGKHNDLVSHLEAQVDNKAEYSYMLCRSLSRMVDILLRNGQPNLAEAHCKTITHRAEELLAADPDNEDYALLAAEGWRGIANAHSSSPYYGNETAEDYRRYRTIIEKLYRQTPGDASIRYRFTDALLESANNAILNGKAEQARAWLQQAESILRELLQADQTNSSYSLRLDKVLNALRSLPEPPAPAAQESELES